MVTKSIFKNINIQDKELADAFLTALDTSESATAKEVSLSRKFTELKGDSVKEFFSSIHNK